MSSFPVIGIVGPQASGKTEVAKKLIETGAKRVRMGDVVWREVKDRGLEITEENVGKVAKDLREKEGPNAVAKRCVPLIREKGNKNKPVVVDGIRSSSEVKTFKKEFEEDFTLISVNSPIKERYRRIKGRKREDDTGGFSEFKEKEDRESGWGLEKAMKEADYNVVNDGSLEDLNNRILEIFREIMEKYED